MGDSGAWMGRFFYPRAVGRRALDRMYELASTWDRAGDRRAVFATAYGRMTEAMLEAISRREFEDPVWVDRLLDRFADYYFDAVDAWDRDTDCPLVWCDAFAACDHADLHTLQVLFLGINAHINHDLVYALTDVLDDWDRLDATRRLEREVDHRNVNLVIARAIDVVQDEVIDPRSPALALLDDLFAGLDEWAFSRLIADWRSDVWDQAQRLLAAPADQRPSVDADITERTNRIARLVAAF